MGEHFSVNIELSNTQADEVVWTMKTSKRPIAEIFEVKQEIAEEVAKKLRVDLRYVRLAQSLMPANHDIKVYELFLKIYKDHVSFDLAVREQSEQELIDLIKIAPDYVPSYKLLANSFLIKGLIGYPSDLVRMKTDSIFKIANQLDPENEVLPNIYGFYKFWFEWDFEQTKIIAQKGLEAKDEYSISLLAEYYQKMGDLQKSNQYGKILEEINPLDGIIRALSLHNLILLRNFDEGEAIAEKYLLEFPESSRGFHTYLILYNLLQGNPERAIQFGERAIDQFGFTMPYLAGHLAIAYHRVGQKEKFEKIVKELENQWKHAVSGSPAFYLGAIYCNIGEPDTGFMWLERSFEARDVEMTWLKMEPAFEPVKNDPRYIEMLARVGFP